MRHLRWVNDPEYRGFCIRKNSTAIMKSGGLFWDAVHLYSQFEPKIKIKVKDQKIVFPSGATVSFSHYENRQAAQLYQGLALSSVMYDEATHAEEEDIWWLISRLRTRAKMTPSIWLTANPDPDSYAFKYAEWYLYPKGHPLEGRPDPEKNGVIRWMLRRDGQLYWADTREELVERFGVDCQPLSFQGLFGTIEDNPTLMESQPEYKANLESLPRVQQERLRWGNWLAREEGAGFFKREWLTEITEIPPHTDFVKIVRAWDMAGSIAVPGSSLSDPDYSVGVKMGKLKNGDYVILDVVRFRARHGDVVLKILETASRDGAGVDIYIPSDPNSAAKAAATMLVQEIISHGFYARARGTNKSKIDRFRPFCAAAQHGLVKIVRGCVDDLENKTFSDNNPFYDELEKFDGGRKHHDDMVDSCGDAFMALAQGLQIPLFELPTFTKENPFKYN